MLLLIEPSQGNVTKKSNKVKMKQKELLSEKEFVTGKELSEILSVSERTIYNNSFRIIGRVKIGGSVKYYMPEIYKCLKLGQNIFKKGYKNGSN